MKLANLNPRLREVLGITRLLTIFEVFDSAEDAAGRFNPLAGQVAGRILVLEPYPAVCEAAPFRDDAAFRLKLSLT